MRMHALLGAFGNTGIGVTQTFMTPLIFTGRLARAPGKPRIIPVTGPPGTSARFLENIWGYIAASPGSPRVASKKSTGDS
jgi:hypothetical protein